MIGDNLNYGPTKAPESWAAIVATVIGLIAGSADAAPRDVAPPKAAPTCALIDFDRSPLVAVLEAKLLSDVEATWLERNAIDEVVKEQELQALFTPEGGAQRSALGKLLKADLLILVRDAPPPPPGKSAKVPTPGDKPVKAIDLAVTETGRGLRLSSRSVPRSDDAEADVEILVQLVREAIAKYAKQVTEIYSVPPFVSRDLGYEHDYLRGAYARLLEQMLLDRPGVLVVELAEAQSLTKEIALADPGSRLARDVPYYLLGEYRNDGAGEKRRVRLSLKLMRGERQLDERSLDRVAPVEAAMSLRKLADEFVDNAAGAKRVVLDPAAEVEALNRREKLFLRLGQWSDALALAEASLLLKPRQTEIHHDAIAALDGLTRQNWDVYPLDMSRQWLAVGYQNRGLEHIDAFMRLDGNPDAYGNTGAGGFVADFFRATGGNVRVNPNYPRERNDTIVALQKKRRAALLRIIPWAARGNWKCEFWVLHDLLGVESVEAQCDDVAHLAQAVKELPGVPKRVVWYVNSINPGPDRQSARQRNECLQPLYERLAAIDNADVRAAAQQHKAIMAARIEEEARQAAERKALLAGDSKARRNAGTLAGIREVKLTWSDASGGSGVANNIDGCLPAGPGVDVVWQRGDIFLMKEPGRMTRVWQGELNSHVSMVVCASIRDHICYDGRLVWAAIDRHLAPPVLLAIGPRSAQVWQFSASDGLPDIKRAADGANNTNFYAVAPISPGKACVAGFFGKTWLAVATVDDSGRKSVQIFHEAREAFDRESKTQPLDTAVAFQPSYMLALADASSGATGRPWRVLVGRGGVQWNCPPLLVDPRARTVSPVPTGGHLEQTLHQHSRKSDLYQDAIYLVDAGPARKPTLYRFALPDLSPEPIIEDVPLGMVVFHDGLLHIVGREWWTGHLGDKRLHRVAGPLPWSFTSWWPVAGRPPEPPETPEMPRMERICHSNHYGLLVKRAGSTAREAAVFAVSGLLETAAKPRAADEPAAPLGEKASE